MYNRFETSPKNLPDSEPKPEEEIKIRVHLANFLPFAAVVGNRRIAEWAKKAGYDDGVEWMAVQPREFPIGPTHEISQIKSPEVLLKATKDIKSAHVIFNPYATTWGVLLRRTDRILPGRRPLPLYHLALASNKASQAAIKKLEELKPSLQVVTFPPTKGQDIYGKYKHPLVQTHLATFDQMGPDEMIRAVEAKRYGGICYDLFHGRQKAKDETYPFLPWRDTLEKFWEVGVLAEVHVQPGGGGQPDEGISQASPDNEKELDALIGGSNYSTELDEMIQFLKKNLGFRGPYVIEVNPLALAKLQGFKALRPPNLIKIHQEIVDHVRRT